MEQQQVNTRNERRLVARHELKQHYKKVARESQNDRTCAKLDPSDANRLCVLRRRRSAHLRHVHLARGFLIGMPRHVIETHFNANGGGSRAVYPHYIADIINGMITTTVLVTEDEVVAWLKKTA